MEILVLIFLLFSGIGDSLFIEKDYFNAITEYKRDLYFSVSDSSVLLRKIALCYMERGMFKEAAKFYSDLFYESPSLEIQQLFALSLIRMKNFDEAEKVLEGLEDSLSLLMLSAALGLKGDYTPAFYILDSLKVKHPEYIKLNKLTLASKVIPGSGLIFLGELPLFLGTISLNAVSAYLIYSYVKRGLYFEAIFYGYPLVSKFYVGGIRNTKLKYKLLYENFFKSLLKEIESHLLEHERLSLFSQ